MNVIFTLDLDENGLLELRTAPLNGRGGRNYVDLRQLLKSAKRIVISTSTEYWKPGLTESCICYTIDPSYEPGPIEDSADLELNR